MGSHRVRHNWSDAAAAAAVNVRLGDPTPDWGPWRRMEGKNQDSERAADTLKLMWLCPPHTQTVWWCQCTGVTNSAAWDCPGFNTETPWSWGPPQSWQTRMIRKEWANFTWGSLPSEDFRSCDGTLRIGTLLPMFLSKQLFVADVNFAVFDLKIETQNRCLVHLTLNSGW